jgi:hypothetical protein
MSAKDGLLSAGEDNKRSGKRTAYLVLFVATCCLVLVAGYSWAGSEKTELEEGGSESDSDRKNDDAQRKQAALRRVSSVQLVSDIKKVLLDVESTLQRSRMRRYSDDMFNLIVYPCISTP